MGAELVDAVVATFVGLFGVGGVGYIWIQNKKGKLGIKSPLLEDSLEEKIDKLGHSLGNSIDTVRDTVDKISDKVEDLSKDQKNTKKNMLEITLKQRLDSNDRAGFYRTWDEFKDNGFKCSFIEDQLKLKNENGWKKGE